MFALVFLKQFVVILGFSFMTATPYMLAQATSLSGYATCFCRRHKIHITCKPKVESRPKPMEVECSFVNVFCIFLFTKILKGTMVLLTLRVFL